MVSQLNGSQSDNNTETCTHPTWEFSSELVTNAKGELQPKVKAKYWGADEDPLVVVKKSQEMCDEQYKYITTTKETRNRKGGWDY